MFINTPTFPLSHRPESIKQSQKINEITDITINNDLNAKSKYNLQN